MADPLATPDDVADIWRTLSGAEQTQVANLIVKASALLRNRLPNIDDRLALFVSDPAGVSSLDPDIVANVVAQMVKRVLVNPVGAVSSSISADGVSRSQSFVGSRFAQPDVGLGELTLTDSDVAKLTPVGPMRNIPASIQMKVPSYLPCQVPALDGVDSALLDEIETGVIYGPYYG